MAQTNIVNNTTGQTGYQVPGAATPTGWSPTSTTPPLTPTTTATTPTTPTTPALAPATAPNNTANVNPGFSQIQLPTPTFAQGNPSNAIANTAGISKGLDTAQTYADQQIQLLQQQAAAQKQNSGVLASLTKSPADITVQAQNALSAAGVDPVALLKEKQGLIEENNNLSKQYADLSAQKDQQLADLRNSTGGTVAGVTDEMTVAERNADIRLNALSAKINANTGTLNALSGQYTQAQDYVQQASTEALANNKYYVDQFTETENQNTALFNNLSSTYKDAWTIAKNDATQQYQENKDLHDQIVKLYGDVAPNAPASTLQYLAGLVANPNLSSADLSKAMSEAAPYANKGTSIPDSVRTDFTDTLNANGPSSTWTDQKWGAAEAAFVNKHTELDPVKAKSMFEAQFPQPSAAAAKANKGFWANLPVVGGFLNSLFGGPQ